MEAFWLQLLREAAGSLSYRVTGAGSVRVKGHVEGGRGKGRTGINQRSKSQAGGSTESLDTFLFG